MNPKLSTNVWRGSERLLLLKYCVIQKTGCNVIKNAAILFLISMIFHKMDIFNRKIRDITFHRVFDRGVLAKIQILLIYEMP